MTLTIDPVRGILEVRPGDDLGALLVEGLRRSGLAPAEGDVVVVTQKVVSKAEGRVVPEEPDGKAAWVARETRRVVARRGELVIAETRHGFVCANAGVDASNVGAGSLTLLPEDPDRSARGLLEALRAAFGVPVGVIVTDTFGRPWRAGLVNVAIGCAGLPALVDLRGTEDASGRALEVTVVALADEIAAASGLVIGKADGVPAALVRGVRAATGAAGPGDGAAALVRPVEEDLFRESVVEAVAAAGDATSEAAKSAGPVPRAALRDAATAASASLGPGRADGVAFVVLDSPSGVARALGSAGAADASGPAGPAAVVVVAVRPSDGAAEAAMLGAAATHALRIALRGVAAVAVPVPLGPRAADALAAAVGVDAPWLATGCVATWRSGPGSARVPEPHSPVIRFEHDGPAP